MRLEHPAPEQLVPGIAKYPDLVGAMLIDLRAAGCCEVNRIAEKYRERFRRRLERDKLTRRR